MDNIDERRLDHVHLGCTQRERLISNYKNMFESGISAGAMEKLPEAKAPGKPETNTISTWSCHMEGHAKKWYCELANKTTEQLWKVATPCIDDHHFLKSRRKRVSGRIIYCLFTNFSDCLYLTRIGRPDFLWSVNKLARAVTKSTKACDKR